MSDEPLPTAITYYNTPRVTDGEIWDALVNNGGNVSRAARLLGFTRTKLQERIDRKPDLIQLLADLREEAVDDAETNQLLRARSGADPQAERFVLQTLGRKRGYSTAGGGVEKGDVHIIIRKIAQEVVDGED